MTVGDVMMGSQKLYRKEEAVVAVLSREEEAA